MESRIYELYVNQGMSTRDVAKELGVSQTTVRRKMKKYNIPTRVGKESKQTDYIVNKMSKYHKTLEVRETRVCENCGKTFLIQPHLPNKNCSAKCGSEMTSKKLSLKTVVKCNNCGKDILKIPSYIMDMNFCNYKCHGEWKSKNLVGENSPFYNRVKRECSNCGKELLVPKSRDVRENVYCDTKCMGEHYSESEMFSGDNSPKWTGGKITRNEYGANWMRQRNRVRTREKYACKRCGKTEEDNKEELSVHHIKNFKLFSSYREANHMSNLVGLCRECHTFVHSNLNISNEYISEDIV